MLNDMLDDLELLFGRFGGGDPPLPCALPNGMDIAVSAALYRAFNKVYKEHRDWFVEEGPPNFPHRRCGIKSRYKGKALR